jgi:hypothetical protein
VVVHHYAFYEKQRRNEVFLISYLFLIAEDSKVACLLGRFVVVSMVVEGFISSKLGIEAVSEVTFRHSRKISSSS